MSAISSSPEVAVNTSRNAHQLADEPKITPSATSLVATAADEATRAENNANNHQSQQQNQQQNLKQRGEQQPLDRDQLEKMAQQLQDFMGEMNRSLQFKVDEDSGRDVIKVLDKESGEVIKQYPSEEVLNLVSKLSESAGILIDQTV
tara:strand:+ start:177 stop:617 length:441 start_codon:yes stop_codon:yes gene_type:complete